MIAQNHRIQGVAGGTPVRNGRPSGRPGAGGWVRHVGVVIKENPLIILVGVFNAIFYGSVIALLVNL